MLVTEVIKLLGSPCAVVATTTTGPPRVPAAVGSLVVSVVESRLLAVVAFEEGSSVVSDVGWCSDGAVSVVFPTLVLLFLMKGCCF